MDFPCLITCDLRLNEPRFASIPKIMKAKKKKVETVDLKDLDLGDFDHLEILKTEEPEKREGGIIVESVDELLDKLRNEAKVL